MRDRVTPRPAYAIFIHTVCEGMVPAWHDEQGLPVTFATEREAQLEIIDDLQERLRQFIAGERNFDDAISTEDFIMPVDVWPDRSISLEDGSIFGAVPSTGRSNAVNQVASDSAAIFAIATSLWKECHQHAAPGDLSDAYGGMDGLMREVMRIAVKFERWACDHVAFEKLSDVWPYFLQDRFGHECLCILTSTHLTDFDEHDCSRIAARLGLTVRPANKSISP